MSRFRKSHLRRARASGSRRVLSKSTVLRLEALEERRLLTVDLRTAMTGEGYLHYIGTSANPLGNEATGFIGANSPSQSGTRDAVLGFDSSSYRVPVHFVLSTVYGNAP